MQSIWYAPNYWYKILLPFSWIFGFGIWIRKKLYKIGFFKQYEPKVPVIVVGNLTVGGTGKTPLVTAIAEELYEKGYYPGIISRGYKGKGVTQEPVIVTHKSHAKRVGDEAVLLAKTGCPVVIAKSRPKAISHLLQNFPKINVIISDDGLQHEAMKRAIEIVVIDGQRRFGNKALLPGGPLREPLSRLETVDFIVGNGKASSGEYLMKLCPYEMVNQVINPNQKKNVSEFFNKKVHAVTGIGHPKCFFDLLRALNIHVVEHPFSDHHTFKPKELMFSDQAPILMTEKDAVKCRYIAPRNAYYMPVHAYLEPEFFNALHQRLQDGQKTT